MFVLDTDTLSLYFRSAEAHPQLRNRILSTPPEQLFISVITVEEQWRGALGLIHRDRNTARLLQAYDFLHRLHGFLCLFSVLPYTAEAASKFASFPQQAKRAGPQDCRTAAIALAHGFTVVTRNTSDFARVPGVRQVDWTLP